MLNGNALIILGIFLMCVGGAFLLSAVLSVIFSFLRYFEEDKSGGDN